MIVGLPLAATTRSYEYLRVQLDQNQDKWLYFGTAAVSKAEEVIATGFSLESFKKTYKYFRSQLDQNQNKWLFFGSKAVDITLAALNDKQFGLEQFKPRYQEFRAMLDQNQNQWLYFGRAAVQKAFDFMGMKVEVKTVVGDNT